MNGDNVFQPLGARVPLTCPTDDKLLLFVLGNPAEENLRMHVASCASCMTEVAELRAVIGAVDAASANAPASSGDCLDEIALAALVEGSDTGSRAQRVAHLAGCGHCRAQVGSLVHLLSATDVAAEVRQLGGVRTDGRFGRVRSVPSRRWVTWGGLAAAAAAVLFVVRPARNDPLDQRAGQHRGPTIAAATAPALRSPVGDVIGVRALIWTAVPDATRYRLALFDARGRSLFEAETIDTTLALPDSVRFVEGQSYLWKVEARGSPERWSSSELVEFRIRSNRVPATSFRSSGMITTVAYALPVTAMSRRDSLRIIAPRLSDSLLIREARSRPLELREAVSASLALAVRGDPETRDQEILTAQRLAAAYASAWEDGFLMREVSRFAAWSPRQRARKVRGDSARRAGITTFSQDGTAAAVTIWRGALPIFTAISDTAGMAATLGNIGAALAHDGSADSAERYLDRALALATNIGDYRVQANAVSELAGLRESRDDLAGANERYGRAIALRVRIGDSRGLASDYNNLAGLARAAGDFELARRQLETALKINRRDDRPEVAATNLVNLAALASMRGDFPRAIAFYNEALTTWTKAARFADVADARRGLGEVELRRGNYQSAESHLAQALAIYERTGPLNDALAVRQTLASTSAARGDLQAAVDELRSAQRLADSARAEPSVRAGIALARADLAMQLNLIPEAERLYASARSQFRSARDRVGEAEAQQGRAAILLDRADAAGARTLLDAALRSQTLTGDRRASAVTRMLLGEVALHRGDTSAARLHLARAASELTRLGDPVAAAAALGQRASLEAAASSPAAAESLYRAAIALIRDRIAPDATWRLHAGLGALRQTRGAIEEASREFRTAISAIEASGRSLAMPERRSAFLTDKWDPYVQLALLEEARGRVATAFDVSERLRANEMLGLLSMGRVAVPEDATAELTVSEQDLRHRIAELTRALEGTATGRTDRGPDISRGATVTREALLRAQTTYSDLQLEMRERAPRHATLVSRTTSTSRDVAGHLARDEAFVEYLLSDERSLAFVITRDTVVSVQLPVSRHDIAQLVDFARGTLQPNVSSRSDSLWASPLRQLYADLIAPIEATGVLGKKTRLTIVPHGELHYLPFAALMSSSAHERFLVERYEITVTPSASVWLALGARVRARPTTGLLAFAPKPEALPWSRREVAAIARLSGADTRVMIGTTATESAFRREAPTRRVIHLATYGVLNKQNPLFSFVEFAPESDDDGRLEAHEVFGMQLTADLVVLSACQTGLASGALTDVPPGDDWVGLVRAFLSAGAGGVMASLWPVQDQATAQLMEEFYARYTARVAPATALARAQRAMIAAPATSHPYQWAGFAVVGSR